MEIWQLTDLFQSMLKMPKYIDHCGKGSKIGENFKVSSCHNFTINILHTGDKQTLNSYCSIIMQLPKNRCKS